MLPITSPGMALATNNQKRVIRKQKAFTFLMAK